MSMQRGALRFDGQNFLKCVEGTYRAGGLVMEQGSDGVWLNEAPPVPACSEGGFVATWDGRLDNRDDLLLRLGQTDLQGQTDAETALATFERWGSDGLRALIGEWSFVIWDSKRRTLHLARDYMGVRPLYYSVDSGGVAWSSDLAELVERCGRRDALSDAFAAHYVSQRYVPGITPYEETHAVSPGTCVQVRADGLSTSTRFWRLAGGEVRYVDRRSYEEHLRWLWREAVGARLRTRGTVWAELSGGLDSSSVACMADWLIRGGRADARAIRLVSHATLQSPEGDERRFIAEVERQLGVRSEIIGVEDNQAQLDPERAWVTPHALQDVGLAMVQRVRDGGGRIVLSGRLGDTVMGCMPDNSRAVFDDLARLDLRRALRNLRAWSRATRKPIIELAWWLFASEPSKPETGAALLMPRLRAMLPATAAIDDDVKDVRRSKRPLARLILRHAAAALLDIPHQPTEIVYAYPYAHRPLVDYVLAIPGEEWSAPGVTRSLMRRAFAGLVPDRILRRQSKGYYPPAAFRALRAHVASLVDVSRLQVVERGWIDGDRLRQALRTLTDGGGGTGADMYVLLRLERWLKAREETHATRQRNLNEGAAHTALASTSVALKIDSAAVAVGSHEERR